MSNIDINKSLDRLNADLKIALQRLESSKKANISSLFSHVRKTCLDKYQKAWETACIRQLAETSFVIFDESDGEILLMPNGVSNIIKNSDKIREIVTKAYDAATGSSIWAEVESEPTISEQLANIDEIASSNSDFSLDSNSNFSLNHIENLDVLNTSDESDDIEISWDQINQFFSGYQNDVLLYLKEVMNRLSSGNKWTRLELFLEPCPVGETLQRTFLTAAVRNGLIKKEGETTKRRYWLSEDRTDYDSFQLIVRLAYPGKKLHTFDTPEIQNDVDEITNDVDEVNTDEVNELSGDQVISHGFDRVARILKYQADKIEELTKSINNLLEKFDGK